MESSSGFTNSTYGTNTRFLNQAINRLRECGSEPILGEMPKIAVIGNQSAGKSSLIEAMSGIRVPRQVGTCTRCPMEVVLTSQDGEEDFWLCQISLRIMYSRTGARLSEPIIVPFGDALDNPEEVEKRLRGAQDAVLHLPFGNYAPEHFLQENYEKSEAAMGFSRNVVRLDVMGSNLVDVTFIDLPGIISNANQKSVTTISDLIREYIRQPDCLILVAISMADDIENQGAANLAREYDRAGKRTIGMASYYIGLITGVLTKADMVTDEERFERWLSIIAGDDTEQRLAHGYYITMQRRPTAMATWQTNLASETDFFRRNPLWSMIPETFVHCIGTLELRKKLSVELSKLIQIRIPQLITEVDRCRRETNLQLKSLPRPNPDPPYVILRKMIKEFIDSLNLAMHGKDAERDLSFMLAEADGRFFSSLKSSIAQFGLATCEEKLHNVFPKTANAFLSELERAEIDFIAPPPPPVPVSQYRTPAPAVDDDADDSVVELESDLTPKRTPKRANPNKSKNVPSPKRSRTVPPQPQLPQTPPETNDTEAMMHSTGEYIELRELRAMLRRDKTRDPLPGSASSALQRRLIEMATKKWEHCSREYFDRVQEAVAEMLQRLIDQTFRKYQNSGLYDAVRQIVHVTVHEMARKAVTAIATHFRMEKRAFTQHKEFLAAFSKALFLRLQDYRATAASDNPFVPIASPHEFDTELDLISCVLAYVQVALRRVVDIVPMLIEEHLQTRLGDKIDEQLRATFLECEDRDAKCSAYLEHDPSVVAKREELSRKMEILKLATEELMNVQVFDG